MSQARPWPELVLWHDVRPRDGPANMAVDEYLLETSKAPVLRVYRWRGGWISFGCFTPWAAVQAEFGGMPGLEFVRRWTAGGIVDHRGDWTYSLIVPQSLLGRCGRPRESYRAIHRALGDALCAEGLNCSLADEAFGLGSRQCFQRPVANDLVSPDGRKIAGAAQRRTRLGLLHQGSVSDDGRSDWTSATDGRAHRLARGLADVVRVCDVAVPEADVVRCMNARYACAKWLTRY